MFDLFTRYYSDLFLIGGLVNTNLGETCLDAGYSDLPDGQTCSDAWAFALYFNSNARYHGNFSDKGYPKGCYIYDNGVMWFNSHTTGSPNSDTQSICTAGSYLFSVLTLNGINANKPS